MPIVVSYRKRRLQYDYSNSIVRGLRIKNTKAIGWNEENCDQKTYIQISSDRCESFRVYVITMWKASRKTAIHSSKYVLYHIWKLSWLVGVNLQSSRPCEAGVFSNTIGYTGSRLWRCTQHHLRFINVDKQSKIKIFTYDMIYESEISMYTLGCFRFVIEYNLQNVTWPNPKE